MGDNYIQLISRIAESSGSNIEEIERRVEAKRAKLSGLVSKEGAAQIVAAELGVNFDQEKLKLSQILQDMRKVNVVGKIVKIFPIREYNKNGREGKVCNLLLADEGSNARTVVWDTNLIGLIESGKLKEGDVVEIANASVRRGEIHLGTFSDIKKSKEKMDKVVEEQVLTFKRLSEVKPGDKFKTRSFIVQIFEPRYFEVNAQTGRKVSEEERKEGDIEIKKRALINVVLDDGSESIRAVIFGEQLNNLGLNEEEIFSLDKFNLKKEEVLGEELVFLGSLRSNQLYNTLEFSVEKVESFNPDELIRELEKS